MIYVDDYLTPARVGRHVARWSHLFADTPQELLDFAVGKLGMRPEWIQYEGTHREHFDVTARTRDRAFVLGAVHLSFPQGYQDLLAERRAVCQCKTFANCQWAVLMGGSPDRDADL